MLRLSAPWLLPIARSPIANGAVLLDQRGRIAAVGPDAAVPRPEGVPERRFEEHPGVESKPPDGLIGI